VLDDGGDPTTATTNARRFVTESKADIIMGSSITPPTIAVSQRRQRSGHSPYRPVAVPDHAGARQMVGVDCRSRFPIMGKVLYGHMKAHNVKTVGYIGYSDSYGDLWFNDFQVAGHGDGP